MNWSQLSCFFHDFSARTSLMVCPSLMEILPRHGPCKCSSHAVSALFICIGKLFGKTLLHAALAFVFFRPDLSAYYGRRQTPCNGFLINFCQSPVRANQASCLGQIMRIDLQQISKVHWEAALCLLPEPVRDTVLWFFVCTNWTQHELGHLLTLIFNYDKSQVQHKISLVIDSGGGSGGWR